MQNSRVYLATPVIVIGLCLSVSQVVRAEPNKRLMKINHHAAKAEAAHKSKEYAEAIRFYELLDKLQPFDASTHYNLACSQSLDDRVDDAIASLRRSIEYGWDDAAWLGSGDEDLAPLRSDSRFSELVADAKECAEEKVYLYAPAGLDGETAAPLIVALHGSRGNARGMAGYWRELADEIGAVVAAPRGISRTARAIEYGWHLASNPRVLDMESSAKAVDEAIALAKKSYRIDDKKVVLAGFSQGSAVALNLLAKRPEEFAGVIAFAPNYKPEAEGDNWLSVAEKRKVRAYLTVGELDSSADESAEVVNQMSHAGLEIKLVEIVALAHEIPADYLEHGKAAIAFLLRE